MNSRTRLPIILPLALLLAGLFSSGCGHTDPARFYSLQSRPDTGATEQAAATTGPIVMLDPVEAAQYLRRPQLILRTDRNQVEYLDYDRWAAPIEEDVAEVLLVRLQEKLGNTAKVVPSRRDVKPVLSVRVKLAQLEADKDGQTLLRARWSLNRVDAHVADGTIALSQFAASARMADLVAAHQANLNALADRIAEDISKLLDSSK